MAVKTEAVNSSQSQFNLEEYLSRKTYETRRKYLQSSGLIPSIYLHSDDKSKALILADMYYYAIEMCLDTKIFNDAQIREFLHILQATHDHCMNEGESEGIDGDIVWFQNKLAKSSVHKPPDVLKTFDSLAQIHLLDAYVKNTYFYNYNLYKLTFNGQSLLA